MDADESAPIDMSDNDAIDYDEFAALHQNAAYEGIPWNGRPPVKRIGLDDQPFKIELDPGNPAADDKGFVKLPNVNLLVELADMREANRSYEANLQVVKQSGDLTSMTIGLLKD